MFNPQDYIQIIDNDLVLCTNPVPDGGLTAITVNLGLCDERKRHFKDSIKRMVLNKLFSPKFAEVILSASDMPAAQTHALQSA